MSLLNRLKSPGPKRIRGLDGGGIRGAITLGFLEKIERL
jgi:patatin-like phospholipase/acyl hydrolase